MKLPKNIHPRDDASAPASPRASADKRLRLEAARPSKFQDVMSIEHLRDDILRRVIQNGQSSGSGYRALETFAHSHPSATEHVFAFAEHVQATRSANLFAAARRSFHSSSSSQFSPPPVLPFTADEMLAVDEFVEVHVGFERPLHTAHRLRVEGRMTECFREYYGCVEGDGSAQAYLELLVMLSLERHPPPLDPDEPYQLNDDDNPDDELAEPHWVEEAVRRYPENAAIHLAAAEVLLRYNCRPPRALELLDKAEALRAEQPGQVPRIHGYAFKRQQRGRSFPRWSQDDIEDRLRQPYTAYLTSRLRGEVNLQLGHHQAALKDFTLASSLHGGDSYARTQAGLLSWLAPAETQSIAVERASHAYKYFDREITSFPSDDSRSSFAAFLFDMGRFADARSLLQVSAKDKSPDAGLLLNLRIVICLIFEKKWEAASTLLTTLPACKYLIQSDRDRSDDEHVRTWIAVITGQKVDSAALLKSEELSRFSKFPLMLTVCGHLRAIAGDHNGAIVSYSRALRLFDAKRRLIEDQDIFDLMANSHLPLVSLLLQCSRKDAAIRTLREASSLYPLRAVYPQKLQQLLSL